MRHTPVVMNLPIVDRRASFVFYRDGLGFDPVGEPTEDGVPEPLQFALNDGTGSCSSRPAASVGSPAITTSRRVGAASAS